MTVKFEEIELTLLQRLKKKQIEKGKSLVDFFTEVTGKNCDDDDALDDFIQMSRNLAKEGYIGFHYNINSQGRPNSQWGIDITGKGLEALRDLKRTKAIML